MIQLTCVSCGKKLRAKADWAGRMAKCPGCGQPIHVPADATDSPDAIPLDDAEPVDHVIPASEEHVTVYRPPERLNRQHRYLICDKANLAAVWENNGNGWMLKTNTGLIPARRNRDKLPQQGEFQLVELKLDLTPEGKRLSGLACYQLASRWALTVLDQGDDVIMEKVTGPGCLNRDQKNAVRQVLKDQFMRPVWQDAAAVLEYLGNADLHSPGVG
jgi:hypothetical protein